MKRIVQARKRIDAIDRRLVSVLCERASIALEISKAKRQLRMPHYQPEREQQVLAGAVLGNRGPLSDAAIRRVVRQVIKETRAAARRR